MGVIVLLSTSALAFSINSAPRFAPTSSAARCAAPLAQDLETRKDTEIKTIRVEIPAKEPKDVPIQWTESTTGTGFKWIETELGTGPLLEEDAVVEIHYTVTVLSSGTTLGTTRGGQPLTVALNRHHVPIWDEALTGMRVGGQRRMLVPPSAIPNTQASKVPGGDRMLRFDIEVIKTLNKNSPVARIAMWLPPYGRKWVIGRTLYTYLFLLSFVPYFLPVDMQPKWYHDGLTPEEIREKHKTQANSNYLGGDIKQFDSLFPAEQLPME